MQPKIKEMLMDRLRKSLSKLINVLKKFGIDRKIGNSQRFSLKTDTGTAVRRGKDTDKIINPNQYTPTSFQLRQIYKDKLSGKIQVFLQSTADNKPANEASKAKEYLDAADVKGKERLEVIVLLNRGEVTAIDVAEAYKDLINTAKEYKNLMDKLKKSGVPQNAELPAIEHAAQTEEEKIKKAKLQQANIASGMNQNASIDKDLPDINGRCQGTSDGLKLEQDVEIALQLAEDFINSSVMSTFDKIMLMASLRTGSVTIEDVAKVQNADNKRAIVNTQTTYLRELSQEELDSMDNITDQDMMELVQAMKERRAERDAEATQKEMDSVENIMGKHLDELFRRMDKLIAEQKLEVEAKKHGKSH